MKETENLQQPEAHLKFIYNETEWIHSPYEVQKDTQPDEEGRDRLYAGLIQEVQAIKPVLDEKLLRLYHLVLGNLYLRRGQCEDEMCKNSGDSYRKAVKLLREYSDSDTRGPKDVITLLIHLSLGKYFRSLGNNAGRSNFQLSIHEFQMITERLEDGGEFLDRKQTQLWLDAKLNIGQGMKNLYDLDGAGQCFGGMITQLKKLAWKDKKRYLAGEGSVLPHPDESCRGNSIYDRMAKDQKLLDSFLVRALMQLATVYRKQREYEKCKVLCNIIQKMDPENIEAKNTLGVCHRKTKEFQKAVDLCKPLMAKGNRYAKLNYWKCVLRQIEDDKETPDASAKEINDFLRRDEQDRELRLLQGRFLQVQGKMKKAYRVFEELYEKFPYISHGTIGLKAYYNMATCLMHKGKYQQARRMLDEILKVCDKDRLARIDLGWCMMKMNQYLSALAMYQEILGIRPDADVEELSQWQDKSNLSNYEKVRQLNNLGECYLHAEDTRKAKCMFDIVLSLEQDNMRALDFRAQCYMQEGEMLEDTGDYDGALAAYENAIDSLKEAIRYSEKKDSFKKDGLPRISSLIIVQAAYRRVVDKKKTQKTDREIRKSQEYKKYLENSLLYCPDVAYSQKACFEIAQFLIEKEQTGTEEETLTFYRAFSRITLWDKEEGYEAFSRFMQSHDIMCLGASKRGKILARLIRIYGEVIRIKEECRYSPDVSCDRVRIPVHYTSLEVLKKLLPKQNKKKHRGRMRLWNSVYMNDPFEGTCFLDLLKLGCKEQETQNTGKDSEPNPQWEAKAQDILSKYFPHLNNGEKNLAPVNSNIYITSLSNQTDDLWMWITYADKVRGCNIVFADDFFDIRSRISGSLGSPVYSDSDYPLYQVQYLDEEKLRMGEIKLAIPKNQQSQETETTAGRKTGTENVSEKTGQIQKGIFHIWNDIEELHEWLEKNKEPDKGNPAESGTDKNEPTGQERGIKESSRNAICSFVADALNEIRFLFKYQEYAQEEEMRLVRRSYEPKFDEKFSIPRMYTEVDREIQVEEVKLGAKVSPAETDEVVSWLNATGRVKKVTKSGKHYK